LTHRHVKWRQPGAVKPAFSRLLTQAVRRMEDDGRIQWDDDRAVWIVRSRAAA
jgi:hypothetical protein